MSTPRPDTWLCVCGCKRIISNINSRKRRKFYDNNCSARHYQFMKRMERYAERNKNALQVLACKINKLPTKWEYLIQ